MAELTRRAGTHHAKEGDRCPECGRPKSLLGRGHVYTLIICITLLIFGIIGAIGH